VNAVVIHGAIVFRGL